MAKFKVNAPYVTVYSKKESKSVILEKGYEGNSEDYDNNRLLVLSNNGEWGRNRKTLKEGWEYKPSIEYLDKRPAVEGEVESTKLLKEQEEEKKALKRLAKKTKKNK